MTWPPMKSSLNQGSDQSIKQMERRILDLCSQLGRCQGALKAVTDPVLARDIDEARAIAERALNETNLEAA